MNAEVLSFHSRDSLSVVQLATSFKDSFRYVSGNSAIKKDLLEVQEVSEAGSVNQLIVINHSDDFVFFMDGDILAGAKQNRVLNTSVLLSPKSKKNLPVSCVEKGRWRFTSRRFTDMDYSAPTFLRSQKAMAVKQSLKNSKSFDSDQGEVWETVSDYHLSHNISSPTSNLSDIYENRKKDFDEFIESFALTTGANGIAMFINKRLLNIDIFNREDIFAEYYPKLLRGAAMDAFPLESKKGVTKAEAKYKTLTFLDQFENLTFEVHPGVGVGHEKRFDTESLTGFELSYDDQIIHLTALNIKRELKDGRYNRRKL